MSQITAAKDELRRVRKRDGHSFEYFEVKLKIKKLQAKADDAAERIGVIDEAIAKGQEDLSDLLYKMH